MVRLHPIAAYNLDGLELFFTPNRKLRASQSAIARMCGVSESTVRGGLDSLAFASSWAKNLKTK